MFLQKLKLNNYRIHQELSLDFSEGINLIVGENARGKTSILEAVQLLICGRSFRTNQIADLVNDTNEEFSVEAHFQKQNFDHRLVIGSDGKKRKIVHNREQHTSIAPLLGLLQGVVMTPDDSSLIKGNPATRRRYLDIQLSQSSSEYFEQLVRYTRAVKQRNHLLRTRDLATIEVWEKELSFSGTFLTDVRNQLVKELSPVLQAHFSKIYGIQIPISIHYKCHSDLLSLYKDQREREIAIGSTLYGPHRDDLIIEIDGKPAKQFASQGQLSLVSLALRFAEWERLCKASHQNPLLLIDDLGMHLDKVRMQAVINHLQEQEGQVFITSTMGESFPEEWNRYYLS